MAVPACYVPVFLKKKHNDARKAVWFTKATVIGATSAFVDSINSHIILQMIRESKMAHIVKRQNCFLKISACSFTLLK